jgi:hypothetical protein
MPHLKDPRPWKNVRQNLVMVIGAAQLLGSIQVHFGTFPEWFAAVGTVGALGVSLWLVKQQHDDRQDERREKRSSQARQVSIWVDGVEETETNMIVSYIAQNASSNPIYQVDARLPTGTQGTFVRYLGMMGPSEKRRVRIMVGRAQPVGDKAPEIVFVDSNDRTWHRGRRGVLSEADATEMNGLRMPHPGAFRALKDNPYMDQLPPDEPRRGTKLDS